MLMNIYNHSSFAITRCYLGIEQDDKDEVFQKLNCEVQLSGWDFWQQVCRSGQF